MKKFLMIFAMCFVLVMANAQGILLQEDFENGMPAGWTTMDADGDGNNWQLLAKGHGGGNCIISESYINDMGPLTPDNYLITPALTIPASSTEATFSFFACAQDASYPAEYYGVFISTTGTDASDFTEVYSETMDANGGPRAQGAWKQKIVDLSEYAGQTIYVAIRHYNCTDAFYLNIDDVAVTYMTTAPTLLVNPTTLNFGVLPLGESSVKQATVYAYNLTEDITVTTTAPFAISTDSVTFTTTATMSANGGTLYVQFTPTAATLETATVTIAYNSSLTATITANGEGLDCSETGDVPMTETFNYGGDIPGCWSIVYGDNDPDINTIFTYLLDTMTSNYAVVFSSYSSTTTYDQYLISPVLNYTGTVNQLEVAVSAAVPAVYYGESDELFQIGYSTTTRDISAFTWGITKTCNDSIFTTFSDFVPATAQYVAIRYFSDYQYYMLVDEMSVTEATTPEILTDVDTINFGYIVVGENNTSEINVTGVVLPSDITVTTTAPFAISIDSVTFATTATLPATGGRIFVQYTPTAETADNAVVTLSNEAVTDVVVSLIGNGVDCDGRISAIPYADDFNASGSAQALPFCWTADDVNNFSSGSLAEDDNCHVVMAPAAMISPEIEVAHDGLWASIDYITYASADPNASGITPCAFRIGYSSTTNNIADFTWGEEVSITAAMQGVDSHRQLVPAGTKFVAIQATQIGTFAYYGIFTMDNAIFFNNFALAEAEIVVNPTAIDFGSISVGNVETRTINVMAVRLQNAITATATAPYEISSDNTTFAATAEIPTTGGNLYVRYAPAAVATDNGTIEFVSDSITATVTLTGSSVDCSAPATLPFVEDFEDALTGCWQNVDADGDGQSWLSNVDAAVPTVYNSGAGSYLSYSFDNPTISALTPNNWLISPTLTIPEEGAYITWYDMEANNTYTPEHYELMVSTNGTEIANFTSLFQKTLDNTTWEQRTIDLSTYAGQDINLAFVHNQCTDGYFMGIDDINVQAGAAPIAIEEATANTVSIYPNPAHSTLNITAENVDNVQIINFLGQVVYSANVTDTHFQINVSNLSNGVYFVRLNGENVITMKFVKK